jgi:hypothetical protein
MSKIQAMMANRDAVVAFIGEFNAENDKPCPSKVIAEKFVELDIKKLLPLLKEDGVLASEKGRYGGYMTLDFANVRAANKAETKTTKTTTKKAKADGETVKVAAKRTTKKKTEIVVPVDGPSDVAGNPVSAAVSSEEAQAGLAAVREIVKNYKKKPEPVIEADDSEEDDADDVKPLSFDEVGPSTDDLEEIDTEYQSLLNDMNDIATRNSFSEI